MMSILPLRRLNIWFMLLTLGSAAADLRATPIEVGSISELKTVVLSATPGDRIELQPGHYLGEPLTLRLNGTAEDPIVIAGASADNTVILSPLRITGGHVGVERLRFEYQGSLHVSAHDFRLEGCVFDDVKSKKWVVVEPDSQRVEIAHCVFQNKTNNAIHPRDCQLMQIVVRNQNERHHIHHNLFRDIIEGATSNGFETFQLITENNPFDPPPGRSNSVVEDNLFVRCNGEREIMSIKSNGNWIRRNTFRASRGGFALRHGDDNVVTHNFLLGEGVEGTEGIRIQGTGQVVVGNYFHGLTGNGFAMMDGTPDDLYVRVEHAVVAFNTFVNCADSFLIGLNHPKHPTGTAPRDCTIVGNVFHRDAENAAPFMVWVQGDEPIDWTWRDNLVSPAADVGFEISGVGVVPLEMTTNELGLRVPASGLAKRTATYDQAGVTTTDIAGQPRRPRTTPGAIQAPAGAWRQRPLTEQDFPLAR